MPTEVQFRGAAAGTQNARVLGARVGDVDTTSGRWNIHDGSTAGGIPHATYDDVQQNIFNFAVASGTNAITATYYRAPSAIQAGTELKFQAANTNTAAATFNPNSLGAVSIKKLRGGVKTALAAGDIISGIVYTLIHDGTDFILHIGGGGTKVIASTNITSAQATLDFSALFSANNNYRILFSGFNPVNNAEELRMRFEQSSSFVSGSVYDTNYRTLKATGTQEPIFQGAGLGYIELLDAQGNGKAFHGELQLINPAGGGVYTQGFWRGAYADNGDVTRYVSGGGAIKNTTAVTGVRFLYGTGNIASGRVTVFEEALS